MLSLPYLLFFLCLIHGILATRKEITESQTCSHTVIAHISPIITAWLFYALLLFLSSNRFLFTTILCAAGTALLFSVNRLKRQQFNEPIGFVDFGLILQIFKYPKFYLPYILPFPIPLIVFFCCTLCAIIFWYEPQMDKDSYFLPFIFNTALFFVTCVALCLTSTAQKTLQPFFNTYSSHPVYDHQKFGLTGALFLQLVRHWHKVDFPYYLVQRKPQTTHNLPPIDHGNTPLPHVVLVQAESFFDARRIDHNIDDSIYENYDRLSKEGISGQIEVAAQGAYTMRTEFSILTGVPTTELGTYGFNPYHLAEKHKIHSIADEFRQKGYRCICIHPNDLSFFHRDKVMPNLGFTEVCGKEAFAPEDTFGPYISDKAVGDFITNTLQESSEPIFIFAITMEAHGPWDETRFADMHTAPTLPTIPEWGDTSLANYLVHLKNTDKLLGELVQYTDRDRRTIIGLYGDHVGSLSQVDIPFADKTEFILLAGKEIDAEQRTLRDSEFKKILTDIVNNA